MQFSLFFYFFCFSLISCHQRNIICVINKQQAANVTCLGNFEVRDAVWKKTVSRIPVINKNAYSFLETKKQAFKKFRLAIGLQEAAKLSYVINKSLRLVPSLWLAGEYSSNWNPLIAFWKMSFSKTILLSTCTSFCKNLNRSENLIPFFVCVNWLIENEIFCEVYTVIQHLRVSTQRTCNQLCSVINVL